MNLWKKPKFSTFLFTTIIYAKVYGPVPDRTKFLYEKMYTVTSAGMSGGRKWEDFRWEDGWPVERAGTKVTGGTMDESTAPDEPSTGEEMNTDPEGAENNTTNNTGQVNSCLNSQQAAERCELRERKGTRQGEDDYTGRRKQPRQPQAGFPGPWGHRHRSNQTRVDDHGKKSRVAKERAICSISHGGHCSHF